MTFAVSAWALRLGVFLFGRIRASGVDRRFARIRSNPIKFFVVWMLQGGWVTLVSLPLWLVNTRQGPPRPFEPRDCIGTQRFPSQCTPLLRILSRGLGFSPAVANSPCLLATGVLLWVVGFAAEVTADSQKCVGERQRWLFSPVPQPRFSAQARLPDGSEEQRQVHRHGPVGLEPPPKLPGRSEPALRPHPIPIARTPLLPLTPAPAPRLCCGQGSTWSPCRSYKGGATSVRGCPLGPFRSRWPRCCCRHHRPHPFPSESVRYFIAHVDPLAALLLAPAQPWRRRSSPPTSSRACPGCVCPLAQSASSLCIAHPVHAAACPDPAAGATRGRQVGLRPQVPSVQGQHGRAGPLPVLSRGVGRPRGGAARVYMRDSLAAAATADALIAGAPPSLRCAVCRERPPAVPREARRTGRSILFAPAPRHCSLRRVRGSAVPGSAMILSLYIINKSGGLIYQRVRAPASPPPGAQQRPR